MNSIDTLLEYSEGEIKILLQKFKEEADDLNISIEDKDIVSAIKAFDSRFKDDPNVPEKELRKYTLLQLLKLVSTKPGFQKGQAKIEPTPDIVYNEDGIVIYSGDVEDKCVKYGRGERWCITKGSFGNYRFDPDRKYPIFYLVKNTNLPDNDPLSFVAIQVRGDRRYVWTNRLNNPHESPILDFDQLIDDIPYLNSIDNIQNILKYVPPNLGEKVKEERFKEGIPFNEWANSLDFDDKKLYLAIRGPVVTKHQTKGQLFDNLSTESFVTKVLPKYDKLAEWLFENPWIFNFGILLEYINVFKPKYQNSLLIKVNSPGHPLNVDGDDILNKKYNFDISKKLVSLKKIPADNDYNFYVSPDGTYIVNISYSLYGVKIDIITEDETYRNIKLSKRTQKYLFDYPDISNIPLDSLSRTIQENDLDNNIINDIIKQSRTEDSKSKKTIKVGDTEVLFDTSGNRLKIYQIQNNSIIPANNDNEDVIAAKNKFVEYALSNEETQNNLISSIFNKTPIFDNEISTKILNNIPKDKLIRGEEGISSYNDKLYLFKIPSSFKFKAHVKSDISGRMKKVNFSEYEELGPAYGQFLNDNNIKLNDNIIYQIFERNRWQVSYPSKIVFANAPNIPYTEDSTDRLKVVDNKIYIVNTANPAESFRISDKTGKILPTRAPRAAGGVRTPAQLGAGERVPVDGAGRRGRPAGGANRPIEGNISDDLRTTLENSNLLNSFNQLPINIRAKFFGDSTRGNLNTDRGVSRRDNLLGNLGHVDYVRIVGPSAIYGIQLESGNLVASIVAQPGNSHWLLTQNDAFQLDSPANLVAALRQRNLTEIRNYIFNEYIESNPDGINELKKHIEETKNK